LLASRELHSVALCEHLHQNLFWACISRIHAQVPLVTSGKLTETLHQQIPCGIDVSVMARFAFWACPKPDIQPQLIEYVPAVRAGLARGKPAIHCDEDLVTPPGEIVQGVLTRLLDLGMRPCDSKLLLLTPSTAFLAAG
jgi:hypothetical protein